MSKGSLRLQNQAYLIPLTQKIPMLHEFLGSGSRFPVQPYGFYFPSSIPCRPYHQYHPYTFHALKEEEDPITRLCSQEYLYAWMNSKQQSVSDLPKYHQPSPSLTNHRPKYHQPSPQTSPAVTPNLINHCPKPHQPSQFRLLPPFNPRNNLILQQEIRIRKPRSRIRRLGTPCPSIN